MTITNHYGITVNSEVPITGVFQNNHVYYLCDEIQGDSVALSHNECLNSFLDEKIREIQKILDEIDGETMEASANNIKDICEELENPEFDSCDTTDWLIGFEKTSTQKDAWYWFDRLKYGYLPDESAEYSAIIGEIYTQVVKSKWLIRCALCSPCYPGQGDADSEGAFAAFSLPPEMYEEKDPIRGRIITIESAQSKKSFFIIHSIDECGRDVWWSNEAGWVEEGFTLFTEDEKNRFTCLPKYTGESNWQEFCDREAE